MTASGRTFEARIQIWLNETDRTWSYRVDLDGTRDGSEAWSRWGARRAAHRLAKRMARDARREAEDYTIKVSA